MCWGVHSSRLDQYQLWMGVRENHIEIMGYLECYRSHLLRMATNSLIPTISQRILQATPAASLWVLLANIWQRSAQPPITPTSAGKWRRFSTRMESLFTYWPQCWQADRWTALQSLCRIYSSPVMELMPRNQQQRQSLAKQIPANDSNNIIIITVDGKR